jgi:uncharacterized protein (UPF0248 family)
MLTSHTLLQQYWYDGRHEISNVRVWYTDRGAPCDRSSVSGADILLEPYYMTIRSGEGEKPEPYHRILLITYEGTVAFENRKIRGLSGHILEKGHTGEQR